MNEPQVKALADCFLQTLSPDLVSAGSPYDRAIGRAFRCVHVWRLLAGKDQGSRSPTEKRVCATGIWHNRVEGSLVVFHI